MDLLLIVLVICLDAAYQITIASLCSLFLQLASDTLVSFGDVSGNKIMLGNLLVGVSCHVQVALAVTHVMYLIIMVMEFVKNKLM